jgi:NOL1/NOP2/fmu family ribosome biogenesis protein
MEIALTPREVEDAIVEYLESHMGIKIDNIELQGYDPYKHIVIIGSLKDSPQMEKNVPKQSVIRF